MPLEFNYKKNQNWGNLGWLGSEEYYNFWGDILASKLNGYLNNKVVLDIGAGNGRIWQHAFNQGLAVKEIHLTDPALNISKELSQNVKVVSHKKPAHEIDLIETDVGIFKQSIHHIYDPNEKNIFDAIPCSTFINFSMPENTEWPLSPALMKKYKPSVLDVRNVLKQNSMKVMRSFLISYCVKMHRKTWIEMLQSRFTSILHDCDNHFIDKEVEWVTRNHSETLTFNDTLECIIFKKSDQLNLKSPLKEDITIEL